MRVLLKPFCACILLIMLAVAAEYTVTLSCRKLMGYLQQTLEKQYVQAAYMLLDRR